ncbi:TonB-dependent siderophore receptor [Ramlibacter sp. MAHUQ-53]|uniref:TonB-dependent siderophore receptor n=1 Tax=unclassified Ramlibacter TaxID=2617605 RepID=UPI00363C888C
MASHSPKQRPSWPLATLPRACLLLALSAAAHAQDTTLKTVTITTSRNGAAQADVTGFGDVPLRELPLSATVIDRRTLEASGARRLADLTGFDASVTDAYNAPGYWDFLSIRGFTLDNRFNYRREGLPISAETSIPLDNKERIEFLRGTSGIQAGTSAPGGLVNYVVKRPTQQPLRQVRLETGSGGGVLAGADISQRFGEGQAFGLRVNAVHERLRPRVNHLDGERSLLAAAADWRISRDSVLEAEIETSRKSQPSQVGFSLLGPRLPAPVNPNLNLNNQPWAQPSVFDAATGTVRFSQAINAQWSWMAQAGRQYLRTDDRTAFPFGCSAEGNYDRYCSDGSFDYYDFRSENERRAQDAAQLQLRGQLSAGGVRHDLTFAALHSRVKQRFDLQAYNWVGTGNVQGTAVVPADPTLGDQNTNRGERSMEFSVQDAMRLNERLTVWAGLRHTQLDRSSVRTNGTRPTAYEQSINTPWAAVSYKLSPVLMAYASWGQGIESQVVPNRGSQYTNAGQALPALKSRQVEAGLKGGDEALGWQVAAFQIHRPVSNLDACSRLGLSPCTGAYDGEAVHRGLETSAQWAKGPWRVGGGVTLLDAKRSGSSAEPAVNGQRPTNVPAVTARLQAAWRAAAVQGLELQGRLSHEGDRNVLPDGSIRLPSWTTVGAAVRYDTKLAGANTTWTLGIDNLFDRRYWRESPYQFGHVYLYPGAARTARLTFAAAL